LPGYPGEEEGEDEEDYDCNPEWHGDRDEEYKDWYSGDYYRQGSSKCKNTSRGSYPCGERIPKKRGNKTPKNKITKNKVEDISCQPSEKKYRQETSLPHCPDDETAQEIQGYHIE